MDERPLDDPRVSELLDELLDSEWTYVGEARHLVDPDDTDLLLRLSQECDRRLESRDAKAGRDRLHRVRGKLKTAAVLNEHLPMTPLEKLTSRPTRTPGRRKRIKRNSTGVALPGYEAYHDRLTQWMEQNGLSQSLMAQRLSVDPSYLSRAIRGERKNRDLFLKIETLTGIAAPLVVDGELIEAGGPGGSDDPDDAGNPDQAGGEDQQHTLAFNDDFDKVH